MNLAAALAMKAPVAPKPKPVTHLKQVANGSGGNVVRKMQESVATAVNGDADWQEF